MENSPGLETGGVCDRLPDILNFVRLGNNYNTRHVHAARTQRALATRLRGQKLRVIIAENVRTERHGRTGGTPAASFLRPPVRNAAFLKPSCKCWILQPMSNSTPTIRILSKHY